MTVTDTLLIGVLPAILLLWIGSRVRRSADGEKGIRRWLLFLLGVLTLLLVSQVVAISVNNRAFSWLSVSFIPVECGTVAHLLLHLFRGQVTRSRGTVKSFLLFLIVVLLYILLGMSGNLPGIAGNLAVAVFIMLGGAFLALVWKARIWTGRWCLAAWAFQVLLLCGSIWVTDTNPPMLETPPWLVFMAKTAAGFLIPGLAVITAARLVYMSQAEYQSGDWHKVVLMLLLVAPILVLVGYQILLARVWDVATDGLAGIFLLSLTSILAIATGMVMAWSLPGKRKLLALAFAVLVPLSMRCAFWMGASIPDGEWGMSPTFVTERRAEVVDRAIHRYHGQHGGYPRALVELVPRNLVYIPRPIMIPGQTWCYEGGTDYYRLGYVHRRYFSTPASVRVHAATGEPPVSYWACEDEAARYPGPRGYDDP